MSSGPAWSTVSSRIAKATLRNPVSKRVKLLAAVVSTMASFNVTLFSFPFSEFSGDVDSLELGDMVEYSLSKGKGNKVSAEKVNKTHSGNEFDSSSSCAFTER